MKKTKDLFMEIREQQLEMLPHEEEFIYLNRRNNVQNNKGRVRGVLGTTLNEDKSVGNTINN
jgi:hypothetical protein